MIVQVVKENVAKIINGKLLSSRILKEYKIKIDQLFNEHKIRPNLAIIEVGDKHDSKIFIRNKLRAAQSLGISTEYHKFPANCTELELLEKINQLNHDPNVHAIVTQIPFQSKNPIVLKNILDQVAPLKDVDCLSSKNISKFLCGDVNHTYVPCAAKSCLALIKSTGVNLEKKQCVVVGSSLLVGKPVATLLRLEKGTTVSVCNKKTEDLKRECQKADVLVVAVGKPNLIKGSFIKKGAIVIDVGINYDHHTNKICGDVDYKEAIHIAGHITPVPGGVGPMTVIMLMTNTYESAIRSIK